MKHSVEEKSSAVKKAEEGAADLKNKVDELTKSLEEHDKEYQVKLFVFGDSYVDTGNFVHSESYKPPSGITFPGNPAGRFCDGRDHQVAHN